MNRSTMITLASIILIVVCTLGGCDGNEEVLLDSNYDPDRGYFIASFRNPRGQHNCSVFWVSNEFFLLSGCPKKSLRGLEFFVREEKITRIEDTKFGAALEFSEILTYELDEGVQLSVISKDSNGKQVDRLVVEIPTSSLVNDRQFSIPKVDRLNSLYFNEEGGSSSIYIMNSKTFLIPHLKFSPVEDDSVFFWVGNARNGPDTNGTKIPNQDNSYEPLSSYQDEMVVLHLPPKNSSSERMTVYDINYIGLWSPSRKIDYDYARVRYPDDTTPYFAPPAFYFNRYLIEGVALCPPKNTISPTIKYNLSYSERTCTGDCCHVPEVESEVPTPVPEPSTAADHLQTPSIFLLFIALIALRQIMSDTAS